MTEFWLFLIAGVIAVAAAALMLLSSNAVHSALFLVVTMVAIAFLFLLLNAPFLAMIQITVYAGAIMVLFLFVIMLLGSEQAEKGTSAAPRRFRWFIPLTLTLGLSLLLAIGLTITASSSTPSSLTTPPPENARLRIVHAAGDAGAVDIQLQGATILSGVGYRQDSGYIELPAGVYLLGIAPAGQAEPILEQGVNLTPGRVVTLIAYAAADGLRIGAAPESLDTVSEDRAGRLVVFNAYPDVPVISVVDYGSEFFDNDTRVIAEDVAFGEASAAVNVPEGAKNWYVAATGENAPARALVNPSSALAAVGIYEMGRNSADLLIVTRERVQDGSPTGVLRPAVLTLSTPARPSFGGPQAIGYLLFIDYLLPFQLLALLLLAAMVGAIVLTHRQITPPTQRIGVRRRVSRPLVNVIAAQVGQDVTEPDEKRQPDADRQAVGD